MPEGLARALQAIMSCSHQTLGQAPPLLPQLPPQQGQDIQPRKVGEDHQVLPSTPRSSPLSPILFVLPLDFGSNGEPH